MSFLGFSSLQQYAKALHCVKELHIIEKGVYMVEGKKKFFDSDGDSLMRIFSVELFVSDNSVATCDFYNREGGLILSVGQTILESLKKQQLYVKKSEYVKHFTIPSDRIEISDDFRKKRASVQKEERIAEEKIVQEKETVEAVEKKFGKKTLKMANDAVGAVEEIMTTEKMTKTTLSRAEEIIEETYKFERSALSGCINALRTVDSYTYNHSFGVYLLFSQALDDFKKHMDKPVFYDTFKALNNNVNFNLASVKKYATAALLHDYGKRAIPKEILAKNSKLTESEFDIVQYHPKIAVKELYDLGVQDSVFLEIIGNHHRDYLTFPKKGQSPLAQIANMIDIYEACRSRRSYKTRQSYNETQAVLLDEKQLKHNFGWDPFLFVTLMKETFPKFEERRIY